MSNQLGNIRAKLSRAERRNQMLELRRAGMSYTAIGKQLGVTRQRVHKVVQEELAAIAKLSEGNTEAIRTMELERLDALQARLWTQFLAGDNSASDRILGIMKHRAKLLGLEQAEATADLPVEEDVLTMTITSKTRLDKLVALDREDPDSFRAHVPTDVPLHENGTNGVHRNGNGS